MAMKNLLKNCLLFIALFAFYGASAEQGEQLTLQSCYSKAETNYPLVKQFDLIEHSRAYSVANVNKGYLPMFNVAGQATYQSEVTNLPISIPNANIPTLSKDQYKVYGEVVQPLTDLFTVKKQKDLVDANSLIEKQKAEVELYKLKDRVNNLYFGVLLLDAQIAQTKLLKKDIESGLAKTNTAIANGTALKSNANNLKAEMLKVDQHIIELKANRKAFLKMLSLFINEPINDDVVLQVPESSLPTKDVINRPELRLFDLQKEAFNVQDRLITSKTLPRFSLFFQGGVGRPALNFLSNDFNTYYIGGLRLNWNLSSLYTSGKEKKILGLNRNALDVQKEVFVFNTNLVLEQQSSQVQKVQSLINTDNDIIILRADIKNATKNQLEHGTATANDYITAANAEDQARQNLLIHRIQLLMAQYEYQTTSGNQ
ncbi:MAG: TolC family protein [Chitinophagaceae bacterium]|nr:TolC family protein [Chitinophagaceae bacterium]MCB0700529.1 TolC family protein [Chitinophagaceae bacterium]